jgi:hypothetical protein
MKYEQVTALCRNLRLECLGIKFNLMVEHDKKYSVHWWNDDVYYGRLYLQLTYVAPCTKTGEMKEWRSGKTYLSSYMTEDEIVKKAYVLFKQAVEHEVMEGFKFNDKIVFNPHVSFRDLIKIDQEITRTEHEHEKS